MQKHKYTFDIIRSRLRFVIACSFAMFIPLILFLVINLIWPLKFFILSVVFYVVVCIVMLTIINKNKRYLLWSELSVTLESWDIIYINNKRYYINDLEYYEYRRGSTITTGVERFVIFLKFKGERQKFIMPCKTSERIEEFDNFFVKFDKIVKSEKNKAEKKTVSKKVKQLLIYLCFGVLMLFILLWIFKDFTSASKLLPAIFVFYSACSYYIFKDKK